MNSTSTNPAKQAIGSRHFMGTFATSVLITVFTLIQGIILARVLKADGRGAFAAIILWPQIFGNLGLIGTRLSITRAAAHAGDEIESVTRAGFVLALLLSVVTVTVGLIVLPLLMPHSASDIMLLARISMILFVPAFILSSLLMGIDHGQGRFDRLNFFRMIQSPVYVLFLIVLLLCGLSNLTYCIWAMMASFWVATLGRCFIILREIRLFGSIAAIPRILRQSMPFLASNILAQLMQRGDRIILLWLMTTRDLGLYAVAISATGVLATAPTSMGIVALSIAAQEGIGKGFARMAKIFRASSIVAIGSGIPFSVALYFLLPLVYGSEFADARILCIILTAASMLDGIAAVLSSSMVGQGKPLVGTFSRFAGTMVMVLVAVLFRQSLGVVGVALGYLAKHAIILCSLMVLLLRHYHDSSIIAMIPTFGDVKQLLQRFCHQASSAVKKVTTNKLKHR